MPLKATDNTMVTSRNGDWFCKGYPYILVSALSASCDVAKRTVVILEYIKSGMANSTREMIFLVNLASIKQLTGILCPDLAFNMENQLWCEV